MGGGAGKGEREHEARDQAFRALSERGGYPIAHQHPDVPWPELADHLNETVIKRAIQQDLRMGTRGQERDERLLEEVFRLCCRYAGQAPGQSIFVPEIQQALAANIFLASVPNLDVTHFPARGFSPATNFAVASQPVSIAIGDLNGDGRPDLAVANGGSNNVSVLLNTSDTSVSQDTTPPTVTCAASPNTLWPPNHKLVNVSASVSVTDSESGPAGFKLLSVTSSEPNNGLGDRDTAGDIQGWSTGTADTNGQLRAGRSGTGRGRTYTLNYQGSAGRWPVAPGHRRAGGATRQTNTPARPA